MASDSGRSETIVQGEASESDDEDTPVQFRQPLPQGNKQGSVVSGEASEDDTEDEYEQPQEPPPKTKAQLTPLKVDTTQTGDTLPQVGPRTPRARTRSEREHSMKYDTLLHEKLMEKNSDLRTHLKESVTHLYSSSAKEVKGMTQQLLKSQVAIQDISHNMRLLTNDLFHLEDKIDIVATCNILPDINIDPKHTLEVKESSAIA